MGGQPDGEEEAQIEAFQAELEANVDALHDHKSGNLKVHFLRQRCSGCLPTPGQCKLDALHEPQGGVLPLNQEWWGMSGRAACCRLLPFASETGLGSVVCCRPAHRAAVWPPVLV